MNTSEGEHVLLFRRDLSDPDEYDDGHLSLPVLTTTDEGEEVHSFLLVVESFTKEPAPGENLEQYKVFGKFPTGESVVCTLTYDNSDYTQMLLVEPTD